MAFLVVDVGKEIALDIDDQPQVRRAVQALAGHGRLAQHGDSVGQVSVNLRIGRAAAVMPDHPAQRFQPPLVLSAEDDIRITRIRIEYKNVSSGVHEVFPSCLSRCNLVRVRVEALISDVAAGLPRHVSPVDSISDGGVKPPLRSIAQCSRRVVRVGVFQPTAITIGALRSRPSRFPRSGKP